MPGAACNVAAGNATRFTTFILLPAGCLAFLFLFCSVFHTGVSSVTSGARLFSNVVSPELIQKQTCTRVFERYVPSELESRWMTNITNWQHDYCTAVMNDLHALITLEDIIAQIHNGSAQYDEQLWKQYLSRFEYRLECNDRTDEVKYGWIEPLVAALRHPISLCNITGQTEHVVDRSYILVESMLDVPANARPRKSWYFDLGASLWDSGKGGASQKYFVEEYLKYGTEFDGMYLWEPKPSGQVFSSKFDGRLAWKYHYYNTFADPDPNNPFNPLNIMKKVATPDDFVMFKLDIDAPAVEDHFVQLLLNDKEYRSYVDEFFFEHHVNFPPMLRWWKAGILKLKTTVADSYSIFSRLRHEGVRAHGWP